MLGQRHRGTWASGRGTTCHPEILVICCMNSVGPLTDVMTTHFSGETVVERSPLSGPRSPPTVNHIKIGLESFTAEITETQGTGCEGHLTFQHSSEGCVGIAEVLTRQRIQEVTRNFISSFLEHQFQPQCDMIDCVYLGGCR
jgi:hypothetical protein